MILPDGYAARRKEFECDCSAEVNLQRTAYTHRSHGTMRSKGSSRVPHGALVIAPDGEVLSVSAQPLGHPDGKVFPIQSSMN